MKNIIDAMAIVIIVVAFLTFIGFVDMNKRYHDTMIRCFESNGSWIVENGQYNCRINGVCTQ